MVLLLTLRQGYQLLLGSFAKPILENKYMVTSFRCWPVDMDVFMHMNNASYIRIAELASWRLLPKAGFLTKVFKNRWALVVVEQKVTYKKSIRPFQRYEVLTNVSVQEGDQKWLQYRHIFRQHKDDVKPGQAPVEFATVEKTGVVKDRSGKTIGLSQFTLDLFK
jgi:acyl-CoA thioesterase FadM